jgi:TonB family protein
MGPIKNARSYVSIICAVLSVIITVIFLIISQLLTKGERYSSSVHNGQAHNAPLYTKVTYNKNPTTRGLKTDKMMDTGDLETKEMKDAGDLETEEMADAGYLETKKQKDLNIDIHSISRTSMIGLFPDKNQEPILLMAPDPVYPDIAKKDGIEGKVVLKFVVDKKGIVYNPEVLEAEPDGVFEESALSAIKKFKFIPAKRNNVTVKSIVYLPIKYEMNEGAYLEQRHEMLYTFQ